MDRFTLKNGLQIIIRPMPNTHSVTVGLYIRAGSKYEIKQENGITHFLEHLHFRRLGNLNQCELYYNMESIGSTLQAKTGRDYLRFSMKILPKYLISCLEIFKNIISAQDWSDEDIAKEKSVVINQISQHYRSYDSLSHEVIFKNSSLSYEIMGTVENLESFNNKVIQDYKNRIFNNNNMLLCVTGNIDESSRCLIVHSLESLHIINGVRLYKNCIASRFFKRKPDIAFENADWDMLDVDLSFDISPNVDIKKLNLLNCIMGEGVGSRLQVVLRETFGYTSDISSYTEIYEECSILHIVYTVHRKILMDSLLTLTDTLNRMKHDIGEKDICVSVPFYSENLDFLLDDTEQMNFLIGYYDFVICKDFSSLNCDNMTEICEDLMRLSKSIFLPENVCLAVVGNCRGLTKKAVFNVLDLLREDKITKDCSECKDVLKQ